MSLRLNFNSLNAVIEVKDYKAISLLIFSQVVLNILDNIKRLRKTQSGKLSVFPINERNADTEIQKYRRMGAVPAEFL
jgi:hypothetical protein